MTSRQDVDEHANDKASLPKGDKDEDDVLRRSKLGEADPDGDVVGADTEHAISDSKLGGHGGAKPEKAG